MNYHYLAIEGTIGAGKTSLSHKLAEEFNARVVLEEFSDNPFLPGFYSQPDKFAFQLELSFLAERYQQIGRELSNRDLFQQMVVSDYILQKSLIFARENLKGDTLQLYRTLYDLMIRQAPKPDLTVYLYQEPEKLKQNILKRGRPYEKDIPLNYLKRIQKRYMAFFRQQRKSVILILDTTDLDFVSDPKHYQIILGLLKENYPFGITRIKP
ncbi:deoxynucleoside kinase [bacterium SCSIO 12741]|nr:deoxynucleoside kinase [bacterium SCSIO 12741]